MNNYVNAYDKHVGSVLVYKGYDEETEEWDGFYYKDEDRTEKLTVDEAVEAFLHNNLVVVDIGSDESVGYFKAVSLFTYLEDDETTRTFEILITEDNERSAFVPTPDAEDVGKVLKVKEKDGEYYASWEDLT